MWEGETLLRGAGGEEIPVSAVIVAHPSTRPGEAPYFLSSVMRDLRAQRRAEAALRAHEEQLSLIYESTSDLMFLMRVERDARGAGTGYRCASVNAAYLAVTGLTEAQLLLDVERIEAGTAMVRPESGRVAPLLDTAVEGIATVARQAGVTLAVDVPAPARGRAAWADPDRVTQVLVNLVGNAVKFTPAGGAVTLALDVDAEAEGMLRVGVRDEGRGIPAEKLATIFEPFEQVDASDGREKGGAGLGLAICRAIVRQHGGRIWAERAGVGAGSTMAFTLPVAEQAGPSR